LLRAELQQVKHERDALAARVRELEQQWTTVAATTPTGAGDFEAAFRIEQSRAKRQRFALSLALVELDDLQAVRDRLGHAAGEDVLSHLGACLEASLRPTDVVGPVDGLAYGVLLTATNLEQALAAISRVQREFAEQPYATTHAQTVLTFSAGIVQWRTDEALGDLLSRASARSVLRRRPARARPSSAERSYSTSPCLIA
jgi:diguanylate cyclase